MTRTVAERKERQPNLVLDGMGTRNDPVDDNECEKKVFEESLYDK